MTYMEKLDRELRAVGITGRRHARIIAEFTDHLASDPQSDLGPPAEIARQFADELGTSLARAAAYRAFAALAVSGVGVAVMFVAAGRIRALTMYGGQSQPTPTWTAPILLISALAAQVALAAGGLALLRAWQLRGLRVISGQDAAILARRSTIGVLAGVVTMASLPAVAVAFPHAGGATWHAAAWVLAGVAMLALVATVPSLVQSARIRPTGAGRAGDLRDDLAPLVPRSLTPLRVALLLAAAILVLLGLAGVVTDDPYDGFLRGIADAAACLAGYAVLGRYLGLRIAAA